MSCILAFTTTAMPFHGMAQDPPKVNTHDFLSQLGRDGQQLGKELGNEAKNSPTKVENGKITVPTRGDDGALKYDIDSQFDVQSLYPGSNPANSSSKNEYFADGLEPDIDQIKGVFNSDDDMDKAGGSAKGSLWGDANSGTPSISGAAYKILVDSSNLAKPDFSTDPMMGQTNQTYENIDIIAEGFGDCSVETKFDEIGMDVHNPEYETCDRIVKPAGDCKIRNTIKTKSETVDVFFAAKGRTWLTVEFELTKGTWKTVAPTDGIQFSGQVPKLEYDSVCSEKGISYSEYVAAWDWIDHGIPGTPDSTVMYRDLQAPSCENGLVGRVQIQDSTKDDDLKFTLGGKFQYQIKTFEGNEWSTESCIEDAKKVNDSFCEGNLSIISGAKTEEACITANGIQICPGDPFANAMTPSPIEGIPNLATELQLSAMQCDFNVGQMDCWIDINGNEQCPHNEGNILNSCTEFENNPQCGFISSKCVDGAAGESGACYVKEEVWDCGSTVRVDTVEKNTEYQCSGPIRCMGDDCLDPTATNNQANNFAKATALLNAAQFMTQDMECTGGATEEGGDDNIDLGCSAFAGQAGTCKIAVGGVSDCCEKPKNIGMSDYLMLISQVPKLDGAVLSLGNDNIIKSSYQTLREPVMNAWSDVSSPFTSYMDNISGAVGDFFDPLEELKDELIEQLKEKAQEMLQEIMGNLIEDKTSEAAASAAANKAAKQATEEMAKQAANMLGAAMNVYTAYVVAIAIIQMVYACEPEELEMNAKRATDSCTYIGSYCESKALGACVEKHQAYCCFNSPLSRIIQEQVRPQLGLDFGTAQEPSCAGVPLDKISEIDWSKIELDEWLAILQQNGQLPDAGDLTMDELTGSGNIFNIKGDRLPADERAMERLEGIDIDAKRKEAIDKFNINPGGGGG